RSLGHKLDTAGRQLARLVTYLDDLGEDTVTVRTTLAFVFDPDLDPASSIPAARLTAVRGFARYLTGTNPRTEIPPTGLVCYRHRRRTPYLFSDEDLAAVIRCVEMVTPFRFRADTLATVIGLLAVTGMRIGEALRLDRRDIDWADAVILVRDTKFGKGRNLPVAPSTLAALRAYQRRRDRRRPAPATTRLFVSLSGTPVAYSNFAATFRAAVRVAGIGSGSPTRPRIHDLRHGFAVQTLLGWYRAGLDVEALLPRLATYLGHREPRFTYTYLTATPELLAQATARLEVAQAVRP
ncbi:MAG: tyrosine-type recombinase/integrase, partial [Sporichthyaceae bacterium]|nr:tyrosine-type recombinase/integrase [Sporichthyaceae bacterium]